MESDLEVRAFILVKINVLTGHVKFTVVCVNSYLYCISRS